MTESRVFVVITGFFLVAAVIYALYADEAAGVALLFGAAVLTAVYGVYFRRHLPEVQESIEAQESGEEPNELYLPHESLWPFGIGIGATIVIAGFAIGAWLMAAGAVVLGRSVVGFVVESRHRG